jgi:hypothetical protein
MLHTRSRRILQDRFHTEINPSTHSSRTWESRTNSTQDTAAGTTGHPRSSSAVATMPGLVRGLEQPLCSTSFLLLHKIDGKPCFTLFLCKKPCFALFFPTVFTKTRFTESNWSSDCSHAHCNSSLSLTMGVISIKLTIQVNIIPGLEP